MYITSHYSLPEFYDLPHQLFRVDFHGSDAQGGAPGAMSIVHDLSTSVQYTINSRATNCTVESLEEYACSLYLWCCFS